MKNIILKEFSKLYLSKLKYERNKYIKYIKDETKYLNEIYHKLIDIRYKTSDVMVNKYTDIIIKVKDKITSNELINIDSINEKLDEYFIKIIEKICPIIYENIDKSYVDKFIAATNFYINNSEDHLIIIYNEVKELDLYLDIDDIKTGIMLIKESIKESNEEIEILTKLKRASHDLNLLSEIIF